MYWQGAYNEGERAAGSECFICNFVFLSRCIYERCYDSLSSSSIAMHESRLRQEYYTRNQLQNDAGTYNLNGGIFCINAARHVCMCPNRVPCTQPVNASNPGTRFPSDYVALLLHDADSQVRRVLRLTCRMPVLVDSRWYTQLLPHLILKIEVKTRKEVSCDDILLKLSKSHPEARMSRDTPAKPHMRSLLVFFATRHVARRIPDRRIRVDGWILVDIGGSVCDECVSRDDLHAVACGEIATADVPPERRTKEIEANGVLQAQVDDGEVLLPGFKGNVVELVA